MVHLRCDFFSEALSLSTSMTVVLPQRTSTQIGMAGSASADPPPVLYLLHGLSDDDTTWIRRTSIERYAAPLGLGVVMPQVHRSFYTDEAYGGRYWTFLSEELPDLVGSLFRVSDRPEETFVAGLSMGGYGASSGRCDSPTGSPPPVCPGPRT
jgi:putative tributyrin esterase